MSRVLSASTALLVAVVLGILVSSGVALAQDNSGGFGIRIGEVPVDLADNPRASTYIVDNVPPGKRMERQIVVSSTMPERTTFDLYVGAAHVDDEGYQAEPRGATNALTTWTSLDKTEVTLDPGQEEVVTVSVDVPADAPEVEQYALIWMSTQVDEDNADAVQAVSRVGIRMYLSVGSGDGPRPSFSIGSLLPIRLDDGTAAIKAILENTGARAVEVSGTLDLTEGPGGLSVPAVESGGKTIPSGSSGELIIEVPNSGTFPAGPWSAEVTLDSGYGKETAAAEISFPDQGEGEPVAVTGGLSPAVWVALGFGVALLVALLALWRKRSPASAGDAA
ncbi:hypothetical protein [Dietzia sp. B32]|uniref:hypothetical protein n=1 Tax=Dietzia sp. B32 TaxID=2915130 RepID=UPI0021AE1E4D|nr:hypothetical protein [Dietzia sp. B32]UVE96419.1 hypothetical protein L8M95_06515 [Dietzia sp. B32]